MLHRSSALDELGRHLWRLSSPNPLLKLGRLEPLAQDWAQLGYEYLLSALLSYLLEREITFLSPQPMDHLDEKNLHLHPTDKIFYHRFHL